MNIVTSFSLYHCTLCNRFHFDDQETYKEHLGHVDDHGIVTRQRVNNTLVKIVGWLATAFIVVFFGLVALRSIFWPSIPKVGDIPTLPTIFCLSCVWLVFVGYGPLTYGSDPWGRNWKEWLRDQMPGVIGLVWFCVFIGALTQMPAPLFSGPNQAPFAKFVICFVLLDFSMLYMLLHFDPSAKAIAKAEAKKDRAAQALEAEVERATKAGVTLDAFTDFSRETEVLVRGAKNVGPDTKDGLPHPVEESIAFFDHWNEKGRLSKLNPSDAIQLKRALSYVVDDAWGSPPLAKKGAEILCTIIDQKMDAGIPGWQALREKCAAIASKGNAVSPTDNITVGNCVGTLLSLWFGLTLKFRFDHDVTHLGWSEASAYALKVVLALAVLSALLFGIFGVVKIVRFVSLRALVLIVRIWRSAERIADDEERRKARAK